MQSPPVATESRLCLAATDRLWKATVDHRPNPSPSSSAATPVKSPVSRKENIVVIKLKVLVNDSTGYIYMNNAETYFY